MVESQTLTRENFWHFEIPLTLQWYYTGNIWNKSENVYENYGAIYCKYTFGEKFIYSMNSDLKRVFSVKDGVTKYHNLLTVMKDWLFEYFGYLYEKCVCIKYLKYLVVYVYIFRSYQYKFQIVPI